MTPLPHRPDRFLAEVAFDYNGVFVEAETVPVIVRSAGSVRATRRNIEYENACRACLFDLGCREEWMRTATGGRSRPPRHSFRASSESCCLQGGSSRSKDGHFGGLAPQAL